jgi:MFS family permease
VLIGLRNSDGDVPGQAAVPGATGEAGRHGMLWLLRRPSFLLIVLANACIAIAGYAWMTFAPAFLARQHGLSLGAVGLRYGLATGIIGIIGLIVTGWLTDRGSERSPLWPLWVIVLAIAGLIPFAFIGLRIGNANAALLCIALNYTIGSIYMVPSVAALQRIAPPDLRATASALMLFVTAMLGGIGPLLVGMASDALTPRLGTGSLGTALLVAPAAQALAAALFMAATVFYRRDIGLEADRADAAGEAQMEVAIP